MARPGAGCRSSTRGPLVRRHRRHGRGDAGQDLAGRRADDRAASAGHAWAAPGAARPAAVGREHGVHRRPTRSVGERRCPGSAGQGRGPGCLGAAGSAGRRLHAGRGEGMLHGRPTRIAMARRRPLAPIQQRPLAGPRAAEPDGAYCIGHRAVAACAGSGCRAGAQPRTERARARSTHRPARAAGQWKPGRASHAPAARQPGRGRRPGPRTCSAQLAPAPALTLKDPRPVAPRRYPRRAASNRSLQDDCTCAAARDARGQQLALAAQAQDLAAELRWRANGHAQALGAGTGRSTVAHHGLALADHA